MRVRDEAIYKESLGGKKKRGVCGCLLGREEASESEGRVSTLLPECHTQQPPLPPHSYRLHVLGPRYYYIQY